jgi:hypothetical protein
LVTEAVLTAEAQVALDLADPAGQTAGIGQWNGDLPRPLQQIQFDAAAIGV